MKKIKIGVFGLGRGSNYFDNITNNDGEIVAVCERDDNKLKEALNYLGDKATDDFISPFFKKDGSEPDIPCCSKTDYVPDKEKFSNYLKLTGKKNKERV